MEPGSEFRTLLRRLASRRTPRGEIPAVRYDPVTQTTMVFENGRWVASWEASALRDSKKADLETGEDQKSE